MTDFKDRLEEELESLRRARDEIRVQIHLGAAEARERWEGLEKDFQRLESKLNVVREGAREPLEDIGEAAKQLVAEIRDGYQHIRKLL